HSIGAHRPLRRERDIVFAKGRRRERAGRACLLRRRGVRPWWEDERRRRGLCSLLAPRPFTPVGAMDTALAPVLSCLFPITSHVGENILDGGVPARLWDAM